MKIINMCKSTAVLMLLFGSASANNGISLKSEKLNEFSHILLVSLEIDLNETNKYFKKKLSNNLNKRECERSIFVKKAELSTSNDRLVIDFTTRITRKYCTRRAKKQLYEKTKNLQYYYTFDLPKGKFVFVETGDQKKNESYNHSLTDVIGGNAQNAIAKILIKVLRLDTQAMSLSLESDKNLEFSSVKFGSDKLIFKLTGIKN